MFGLIRHTRLNSDGYHSFRQSYCGVCKTIGVLYGHKERLLLNNDIVFLSELLADIRKDKNDFEAWTEDEKNIINLYKGKRPKINTSEAVKDFNNALKYDPKKP